MAPFYGYETRKDTRHFDPESSIGRLMVDVVNLYVKAEVAAERARIVAALMEWRGDENDGRQGDRYVIIDRAIEIVRGE